VAFPLEKIRTFTAMFTAFIYCRTLWHIWLISDISAQGYLVIWQHLQTQPTAQCCWWMASCCQRGD